MNNRSLFCSWFWHAHRKYNIKATEYPESAHCIIPW